VSPAAIPAASVHPAIAGFQMWSPVAIGSWRGLLLSGRPARQAAAPWPAAAAAQPDREPSTGLAARRSHRTARPAPGLRGCPPRTAPVSGRAVRPAAEPGPAPPASGRRRPRSHRSHQSAATNVTSPAPQPRSSTRIPGRMPGLGEDHPGCRCQRCALDLKAGHLVFTDAAAELVAGVNVTHRGPSLARPATMIRQAALGARAQACSTSECGGSIKVRLTGSGDLVRSQALTLT
jgi:hypothetical protein